MLSPEIIPVLAAYSHGREYLGRYIRLNPCLLFHGINVPLEDNNHRLQVCHTGSNSSHTLDLRLLSWRGRLRAGFLEIEGHAPWPNIDLELVGININSIHQLYLL